MMHCQDYEVADVKCVMEATGLSGQNQRLFARLRKPENFRGHPLFADDPQINPLKHELCQILPDPIDLTGRIYRLDIKDFSRCGVTHHGVSNSSTSTVKPIFHHVTLCLTFALLVSLFQIPTLSVNMWIPCFITIHSPPFIFIWTGSMWSIWIGIECNWMQLLLLMIVVYQSDSGLYPRSCLVSVVTFSDDVARPGSYFSLQTTASHGPFITNSRNNQHSVIQANSASFSICPNPNELYNWIKSWPCWMFDWLELPIGLMNAFICKRPKFVIDLFKLVWLEWWNKLILIWNTELKSIDASKIKVIQKVGVLPMELSSTHRPLLVLIWFLSVNQFPSVLDCNSEQFSTRMAVQF